MPHFYFYEIGYVMNNFNLSLSTTLCKAPIKLAAVLTKSQKCSRGLNISLLLYKYPGVICLPSKPPTKKFDSK